MRKALVFIIIAWLVLVSTSVLWNFINAKKQRKRITFQTARTIFTQLVLTREWNADHGGVYVSTSFDTQPNPYLEDPLRDIEVNRDLKLTKVNPAFMTRQLSEIAAKREGVQFHITSLEPIRPQNRPTAWETKALEAFEKGTKEVGEFVKGESNTSFRYMAPLMTQETCLKCHAKQE